jgi:site-specific DNA-methyltransferase (adenine-specific)
MRSHEMMYVFSKAGAWYNRVDISGDFPAWVGSHSFSKVYNLEKPEKEGYKKDEGKGKRCALSVISNIKTTKKGQHPTEKPIELYKFLIERYCPAGGTVLDPTFGSCNSGLAAKELGRNYIGIEKDKGFYEKAVEKFRSENSAEATNLSCSIDGTN